MRQTNLTTAHRMLIEKPMPVYNVRVRRELVVSAPVERVYAAILTTDLNEAPLARLLHPRTDWLERWHHDVSHPGRPPFRLLDLRRFGFIILAERTNDGVVLGAIVRLWSVRPLPQRVPAEFFGGYAKPGFVKTVVSFEVEPLTPNETRLTSEIRFLPTDRSSRRRFRVGWPIGWLLVHLVQREALRLIGRRALKIRQSVTAAS